MAKRTRRNHSPAFKAKVVVVALLGDRTLAELAEQLDVHPNQVQDWKQKSVTKAEGVFGPDIADTTDHARIQQKLHAKIGMLTMEKDFLDNALGHGR